MAKWLCAALASLALVALAGVAPAEESPTPGGPAPAAARPPAPPAPPGATGFPVRLAGEEVFRLYDPHGAEEAVRIAEERLLRIARDPFYAPGLLSVLPGEDGVWVLYRDARVGFVDNAAAARVGLTAEQRARDVIHAVEQAVDLYRARQSPEEWTRALLMIAVATALLVAAIRLLLWLHRRLSAWLEARAAGLKLGGQRLGFRSTASLVAFERRALSLVRSVLIVVFVLVYLQAAFTIVPVTRGYAFGVIGYLLDPLRFVWLGLLQSTGDFFFIIVIVVLARLLLRGIRLLLTEAALGVFALPGVPQDRALPLYKIVRIVVVAITIVMIYPYIPGSNSAAFQGVSLFAGALFTLGASSTASNFIGGIVLVFSGSFRVGDRVKIGDVVGNVEESTLALTRLRTPKNELVTIANGNVLNQGVVNYSALARKEGVIVHAAVTIGYDVPWRKVHELLVQAALRTEHVLEEPAPFVLQTALNDYHVGYQINAYTREASRMVRMLGELHQNIQDAFAEAGVEILSPAYSSLRDGGASTVPAYEAPSST